MWMFTNFKAKSRQSIPRLYLGTLLMSEDSVELFGPFMLGAAALMNPGWPRAAITTPKRNPFD